MGLSKDECRELARQIREISVAVGDFRFEHWGELTAAQRQDLERDEASLLTKSGEMITRAVGLTLEDMDKDLKLVTNAIEKARKALKTIQDVKNVIAISAGVIGLGGAIFAAVATQNPALIGPTAASLTALVKDLTAKSK